MDEMVAATAEGKRGRRPRWRPPVIEETTRRQRTLAQRDPELQMRRLRVSAPDLAEVVREDFAAFHRFYTYAQHDPDADAADLPPGHLTLVCWTDRRPASRLPEHGDELVLAPVGSLTVDAGGRTVVSEGVFHARVDAILSSAQPTRTNPSFTVCKLRVYPLGYGAPPPPPARAPAPAVDGSSQ